MFLVLFGAILRNLLKSKQFATSLEPFLNVLSVCSGKRIYQYFWCLAKWGSVINFYWKPAVFCYLWCHLAKITQNSWNKELDHPGISENYL